jgi:heme exporter protein D
VVGNLETAPWVWVVVAIVVVVLIVLLLLTGRRRKALQQKRDEAHREKAAEIRREAEKMELDAREREA